MHEKITWKPSKTSSFVRFALSLLGLIAVLSFIGIYISTLKLQSKTIPYVMIVICILLFAYTVANLVLAQKYSEISIRDGDVFVENQKFRFKLEKEDVKNLSYTFNPTFTRYEYKLSLSRKDDPNNRAIRFFDQKVRPIQGIMVSMGLKRPFTLEKLVESGLINESKIQP